MTLERLHQASASHISTRENRTPKIVGADVELGNFIVGTRSVDGSGYLASRAILREITGVSQWSSSYSSYHLPAKKDAVPGHDGHSTRPRVSAYDSDYWSQDYGRKFLSTNGGCCYCDLNHLELCIPEVTNAYDFVAAWHAMLLVARAALDQANDRAAQGQRIQVLVNNSDGLGNSYGSHLNFLLSRRTWENIFHRKLHWLAYLASYQATSIVIAGQGKVGAENGAPSVDYQLSQRADFFETMVGSQTTYRRPLVNSRDEPLCGTAPKNGRRRVANSGFARLHNIFYDSTLCHVASLLKVGMLQVLLAMLEAGRLREGLILNSPLHAIRRYSHDPTLTAQCRTVAGKRLTAVQWQQRFLDDAQRFVDAGGCDGVVPHAAEILSLCREVLARLAAGDLDTLVGCLDWVTKLSIIQRAMSQRPGLTWRSPEVKHLDHLYSSLDPTEGLYWIYEKSGLIRRVVSDAEIERMVHEPPHDTRAYTRAMLLRLAGSEHTSHVDWDVVSVRTRDAAGWPTQHTVEMPAPTDFTKAAVAGVFERGSSTASLLESLAAAKSLKSHPSLQSQGADNHVVP
jgi:Pup amidohydrolase